MTKEFGEFLQQSLANNDMNQKGLAEKALVKRSTLNIMVNGKTNAAPGAAMSLAKGLNIPDERLVEFLLLAAGHSRKDIGLLIDKKPIEETVLWSSELNEGDKIFVKKIGNKVTITRK